jgi:hypothetical protein
MKISFQMGVFLKTLPIAKIIQRVPHRMLPVSRSYCASNFECEMLTNTCQIMNWYILMSSLIFQDTLRYCTVSVLINIIIMYCTVCMYYPVNLNLIRNIIYTNMTNVICHILTSFKSWCKNSLNMA